MPGKAKQALHDIYRAAGRQEAEKVYGRFKDLYEKKFPRAVACLEKDREELERLTRCKHPFRYTLFSTLASIRRSKCSSTWTGLSPPVMSTPSSMLTVKAPESAAWRVEAMAPEVSTETRRNPLIASRLCEIGFVWLFFLSLVERDASLRGLPLQNSERVKCPRWAVNHSLRRGPGTRVPRCAIVVSLFAHATRKSRRSLRALRFALPIPCAWDSGACNPALRHTPYDSAGHDRKTGSAK